MFPAFVYQSPLLNPQCASYASICCSVYCLLWLYDVAVTFPRALRLRRLFEQLSKTRGMHIFYSRKLVMPFNAFMFYLGSAVFCLSCLWAVFTPSRLLMLVALASFYLHVGQIMPAFHVHNKIGLFPTTACVFIVTLNNRAISEQTVLCMLYMVLCCAYFSSAVCKLRFGGNCFVWADGLALAMAEQSLTYMKPWSMHIAKRRWLVRLVAAFTLFIELLAPLLTWASPFWFGLLTVALHIGIASVMKPYFLRFWINNNTLLFLPIVFSGRTRGSIVSSEGIFSNLDIACIVCSGVILLSPLVINRDFSPSLSRYPMYSSLPSKEVSALTLRIVLANGRSQQFCPQEISWIELVEEFAATRSCTSLSLVITQIANSCALPLIELQLFSTRIINLDGNLYEYEPVQIGYFRKSADGLWE